MQLLKVRGVRKPNLPKKKSFCKLKRHIDKTDGEGLVFVATVDNRWNMCTVWKLTILSIDLYRPRHFIATFQNTRKEF